MKTEGNGINMSDCQNSVWHTINGNIIRWFIRNTRPLTDANLRSETNSYFSKGLINRKFH